MRRIERMATGGRAASIALLVALAAVGCSETRDPLDWRDSTRGVLGDLERLSADTLVVYEDSRQIDVATGAGSYFLAGRVAREGGALTAKTFVRWDLSTLPEGEIVEAKIEMHLDGVDEPVVSTGQGFRLVAHEVLGAWTEENLNTIAPPEVDLGTVIGEAEIDTSGLAVSDSVLYLPDLFAGTDPGSGLLGLVRRWQADSSSNRGLMLRPAVDSDEGFLRFFSQEGQPSGAATTLLTPLLVLEIQGEDTTTVSQEALDDAYVIDAEEGLVDLPEGTLLVSSGFVHHAMLLLELPAPLGPPVAGAPPAQQVLQGLLTLRLAVDSEWSLPEGESMTLSIYDARVDTSLADPWPETLLVERLDRVTIRGGDTLAVLEVAKHLQRVHEGSGHALVLQSEGATNRLLSLVIHGGRAASLRPSCEISYAPRLDRLGQ